MNEGDILGNKLKYLIAKTPEIHSIFNGGNTYTVNSNIIKVIGLQLGTTTSIFNMLNDLSQN